MSAVLPEHILKLMSARDRAALGKAGWTADECIAKVEHKLESELQGQIADLLRLRDVRYIRPPMRKKSPLPPGWPDFSFAYRGVPVVIECKVGRNQLDPDQVRMRDELVANGWRHYVARTLADVQAVLREIDQNDERP